MIDDRPRTVPCPGCQLPAVFGQRNPWRPFCSERCRTLDLGAWASERFRLPDPVSGTAESDDDAPISQH